MKRTIKKAIAVILAFVLTCGVVTCFAAEGKEYYDYGTYVLLGDSVASGHNDLVYVDSEFKRVDDSYGAYVADDLGVDYIPMACPGFRTIEIRYMLEDDYEGDEYLFHDAHDPEVMKSRIPEYRRAISEAGLITLEVGGNDFGTMLTWVIADILEKEGKCSEFVKAARDLLAENGLASEKLDKLVDLADMTDAMPELIRVLPQALAYGLKHFFENWNIMIEDIYALNPDVELLVIGLFENNLKSEEDVAASEAEGFKLTLDRAIVEMANKPMKEGAEKYGYTFVDVTGTICDTYHPNAAGHRFMADKILEALPDAGFPFTDVAPGSEYYDAIECAYRKGIMTGISETEFSPDAALTKASLAQALYSIAGNPAVETTDAAFTDVDSSDPAFDAIVWACDSGILGADKGSFAPESEINTFSLVGALLRSAFADSANIFRLVRTLSLAFNLIKSCGFFNLTKALTRAQAAQILVKFSSL